MTSAAASSRKPEVIGSARLLAALLSLLPLAAAADTGTSNTFTLCPSITSFAPSASSTTPGQPVTLTWTSSGGATASIDNGVGSVPTTGSKVVSPSATTTYTLSVANPRGTVTSQTTVTVIVSAGCAPIPSSPVQGATVSPGVVTLEWQRARAATQYDLYLDTRSDAARLVASGISDTGGTVRTTVSNLAAGTTYYWRVVARGDPACPAPAATSSISSFRTEGSCGSPGDFALQSPGDGAALSGTSTLLTWSASQDAGVYDVYLGTTNPPPLYQADLSGTTLQVSSLASGGTYYWYVVARAACDRARTTGTSAKSFRVSGACSPPGPFQLLEPANGASQLPPNVELKWTASQSSGGYDVSLGTRTPPPLYQAAVTGTSLRVTGLARGTYFWKVTARAACSQASPLDSSTYRFDTSGDCVAPPRVELAFLPPGKVAAGESYVVIWRDAGLGPGGGYLVQRSTDSAFGTAVESQVTTATSASFATTARATYYHRVRAVNACDQGGPFSDVRAVDVEEGKASVVFSKPPQAVVADVGASLDQVVTAADPAGALRTVTIQNVSTQAVTAVVAFNVITPDLFFNVTDAAGRPLPPGGVRLAPGETQRLRVRFSGVRPDAKSSHEGVIYVFAGGQPIVPYTFVNLKLGATEGAAPGFLVDDVPAEYAFFQGFSGTNDQERPPLMVKIQNTGPAPMELGAEIGPEVWLQADAGWNGAQVAPGGTATVTLRTKRSQAPAGSALPRYTYFTVRTKEGKTARILVQDGEVPNASQEPRSLLGAGESSLIAPSVVSAASAIGRRFVSRITLTNLGTEDVDTELFYTPTEKDGFSASVLRRKVRVPKHDVVSLTDPLVQLFGVTGAGQLEVRADPQRLPFLRVTSGVDSPEASGGSFGFQLPPVPRGTGATLGQPHVIPGVTHNAAFRTNLILVETTGREETAVEVSLYDKDGTLVSKQAYFVNRYGHTQINRIVERLGGGTSFEAGLLEIAVKSGGGAVAGVITVTDNQNDDAVAYYSVPAGGAAPGFVQRAMSAARRPLAAVGKRLAMIPALVNGYKTFPSSDLPYTFASTLGLASQNLQPATFKLTYREFETGRVLERVETVPPRATKEFKNVLQELFGIAPDQRSNGPLFIEADTNGTAYCKVYSTLDKGTLGDSFPVIDVPSERLTGDSARRPMLIDGLEQSLDASRGTRSNLILNEVAGRPAKVRVSLFEPGNRSRPIAEAVLEMGPYEKRQLSTVFGDPAVGLNEPGVKQKERTNVLCVVEAIEGEGLVAATVTKIDNRTGDTRNETAAPATPTIGF